MALAFVQSADAAGTNTASPAFGSNVTAGNKLLCIGGPYANAGVPTETVTGVTDSQGNTWTLVRGPDNDGAHTKGYVYETVAGSTGACTVTLTCSGAPSGGGCIAGVFEISGTSVTVETSASTSGTGSGVVSGPSLTTAQTALLLAFQFSYAVTNSANNGGWTGSVTGLGDGVATLAVGAATTAVGAFNMTASGADPWFVEAVALKEAASGSATGSSSGTSTAAAIGAALVMAVGACAATSTAAAVYSPPAGTAPIGVFDVEAAPLAVFDPLSIPIAWFDEEAVTLPSGSAAGAAAGTSTASGVGRALAASVGAAAGTSTAAALSPASYTFDLAVDASGRYLLNNGQPFPLHTRAMWFAPANATDLAEVQTVLTDTAAKGYTAVIVQAIVTPSTGFPTLTTAPKNQAGDQPFTTCVNSSHSGTTNLDEAAAQTAYWAWVDSIVDEAAARGLVVLLYHSYVSQWGAGSANQGWEYALQEAHNTASSYAACTTYGQFLGNRYAPGGSAGRSNVILCSWGDTDDAHINATAKAAQQAIWAGVRSVSSSAIYTGETGYPDGLLTDQSATGWGTPITPLLNAAYFEGPGGDSRPEQTGQRAWGVSGPRPCYAAEGPYSGVGRTPQEARRSRWRAWLGGMIAGVNQGTSGIWDWTTGGGVTGHLSDTTELQHAAGFLAFTQDIRWWKLAPVLDGIYGTNNLISTAIGAWDSDAYVVSAQSADATLAVLYISSTGTGTQSVGVALSQMASHSTVRARWFDPTSGAYTLDGNYAPSGNHTFVSPGTNATTTDNDWVLLLESASGDGLAAGTSTATAVALTGSIGSAAGTSTATAVGTGIIFAAGSSAGTSTATAVGLSTAASAGAAAGTSTATATGASAAASPGTSASTSTAVATGASSAAAAGASAGTSTATATGAALDAAIGAATGTGTATGVAASTAATTGTTAGTSTATSVGASLAAAVGSAAGTSTASGVAPGGASGAGSSTGTSTATGVGASGAAGAGASAGTSTATAAGVGLAAAVGSSAGTSTATGVAGSAGNVGTAAGTSSALAIGQALAAAVGAAAGTSTATATTIVAPSVGVLLAPDATTATALLLAPDSTVAVATLTVEVDVSLYSPAPIGPFTGTWLRKSDGVAITVTAPELRMRSPSGAITVLPLSLNGATYTSPAVLCDGVGLWRWEWHSTSPLVDLATPAFVEHTLSAPPF